MTLSQKVSYNSISNSQTLKYISEAAAFRQPRPQHLVPLCSLQHWVLPMKAVNCFTRPQLDVQLILVGLISSLKKGRERKRVLLMLTAAATILASRSKEEAYNAQHQYERGHTLQAVQVWRQTRSTNHLQSTWLLKKRQTTGTPAVRLLTSTV